MKNRPQFTAIIAREGDWYIATCPELGITSQGRTAEESRANLAEATGLFLEVADPSEIEARRAQSQTRIE